MKMYILLFSLLSFFIGAKVKTVDAIEQVRIDTIKLCPYIVMHRKASYIVDRPDIVCFGK